MRAPAAQRRARCSRSKWFAIGMLIAVGAWGLHVGALALAPMSRRAGGLAGGRRVHRRDGRALFGFEVGRRQWIGRRLTALGLVLLGLTLPAHARRALAASRSPAMISFEAGLFGSAAC